MHRSVSSQISSRHPLFCSEGEMVCRNGSNQVAGLLLALWCNKGACLLVFCVFIHRESF